MTGPRDDVTGHVTRDHADRVLSLLRVPPPPDLPVYGGGGVSVGPTVCLVPGAISMKEDLVQGAPLHSHTQISYAGTRDHSRRLAYMPATFVVAHGLLSPMQWCGRRFSAAG